MAVIAYKAVGGQMMSPDMFMRGVLLDLVVAAIIAYLMGMGQLRGYLSRFLLVCPIGLALGLFTNLNNWNGMSQSLHCRVVDVIDPWIAWTLAEQRWRDIPENRGAGRSLCYPIRTR